MDHFHDDLIDILPGPSRRNIIWDNRYHVSEDVWDGSGREELECVCGNRAMRDWKLRRPQRELLHMLGFGIFSNPHVVLSNDARLISALIERWRPETNTFFMRQGEMTVTLEDVGYILGLPVVGEAVTCGLIENRREFFVRNWFEPLTGVEVDNALFRNHIKLTWLFDRYGREKPEKGNVEATVLHTQAYLLFLFGAVLFPTTDKAYVHVRYIVPVQNIREIPNYAWGAAVLAHLYRGLEHAAMKKTKMVAACVWLLHIWSYERFPRIGVPQRGDSLDDYPVAEGWAYSSVQGINKKRRQSGPHHSLPFYRGEFDGVAGDDVVWRPYARFDEVVDWEMLQAQLAGNARVSLICFDVVEWQHPDRVIRQFDCDPHIPEGPVNMLQYRQPKGATFAAEDWLVRWFTDIGRWARFCNDLEGLVECNSNIASHAEYMAWYSEITRARVGKPEPVPQKSYQTRELYDSVEGYRVMVAALDMLKKLDPYFIVLGWDHMKKIRRAARKGKEEERKAWHEALRSFNGFATSNIGPSVDEADYIFIPCCVSGVHWILFMISTKTFDVILLDSMSDEPTYAKEIQVVSWLLPRLLVKLNPSHERDPNACEVLPLPHRPKQMNYNDCGVFVMKYMDHMLQGYDLTSISWSQEVVDTFRCRIAKELQEGKARGISGVRMRERLQLVQ